MLKSKEHCKCQMQISTLIIISRVQILHLVDLMENIPDIVYAIKSVLEPLKLYFHRSSGKLYPTLLQHEVTITQFIIIFLCEPCFVRELIHE